MKKDFKKLSLKVKLINTLEQQAISGGNSFGECTTILQGCLHTKNCSFPPPCNSMHKRCSFGPPCHVPPNDSLAVCTDDTLG